MQNSYYVLTLLATGISAFSTAPAMGQDYPNRVVHIVTAPVGGNSDLGARLIAAGLTASLGQPAVVEPRQGGTIGGEIVAKAAPDGYTLFYTGNIFWTLPLINKDISYDVVRDFMPITLATREPLVVAVHPSLPTRTVRELIALAKARPGQINFGTGGIGSSNHIAAPSILLPDRCCTRTRRIPIDANTAGTRRISSGLATNARSSLIPYSMFSTTNLLAVIQDPNWSALRPQAICAGVCEE